VPILASLTSCLQSCPNLRPQCGLRNGLESGSRLRSRHPERVGCRSAIARGVYKPDRHLRAARRPICDGRRWRQRATWNGSVKSKEQLAVTTLEVGKPDGPDPETVLADALASAVADIADGRVHARLKAHGELQLYI